ncbi:MAG: hypothetical protein HJJLKODD_02739 [Phycisphaerae bacterium]|nr:hypothetical protein [Phycisphaerae bacterium]
MNSAVEQLDQLLAHLETALSEKKQAAGPTAQVSAPITGVVEQILQSAPRNTEVRSLQDSDEIRQFRQDLLNGLVRMDRLNLILRLVSQVVGYLTRS